MRNNYLKMENYRTIQGKNPKNLTGYSQQNDILGKTLNNQKPHISNNPFYFEKNKNSKINPNNINININNQNFQNINQNQNQNKSLSYLNHQNMKINGIFPNTVATNNEILLNPGNNSSKQASNISAFSQNPNEQKIINKMYNDFKNMKNSKKFTNDLSKITPNNNIFNNNNNMNDFNNANNNNINMNNTNNNMNNNMISNNNDFFNNMNNNNINANNNNFFNNIDNIIFKV